MIENSPVTELSAPMLSKHGIRLYLKRDDQLGAAIQGNKWRKLKYNLAAAKEQSKSSLVTFGGAYSNHIVATAAAAKTYGFKSIGIIRGDASSINNASLSIAADYGMEFHFVDRSAYRDKKLCLKILELPEDYYLIPEGGTNDLAIKGCKEIVGEIRAQIKTPIDYYLLSCGTGGTFAGVLSGLNEYEKAIGFSALKGDFHQKEIRRLLPKISGQKKEQWSINTDYHFGGYAKHKVELIDFINNFSRDHEIQLDPIYTGKLVYGIFDLIGQNYFREGSTLVAIHTGGLQGLLGFRERFGNII